MYSPNASQRKDVRLLDGTPASCAYEIDAEGFILLSLHNATGDITEISESDYDHIEAQCLAPPPTYFA